MIGGRSGRSGAGVASIPPFLRCAPRSGISAFSLSGRQRSRGLLRQKRTQIVTRGLLEVNEW